ncbi:MAG TPA: serine/threonine-protein kinase [Kofleriaceae bacterium]|nr:serine/threonine-protein kinase [Kofleriaceae bacterium]
MAACHTLPSASRLTVASAGGVIATLRPRTRIGRYAIEGLLGAGGMAVVYLARDPVLDRAVALKVMRVDGDEPGASRLVREGQALARISHPNVISVHEVGRETDGLIYIAMERIAGTTLAAWLETPRAPHEILRVFAAAGRGLSAAHAAGLVHRDFKPENVMVGDDGRVCVLDFGLARASRDADGPDADHEGIAGTPAYMSPEQWRGERAGVASDQFSFCVALWRALTGEHPFELASRDALRRAVIADRRWRRALAGPGESDQRNSWSGAISAWGFGLFSSGRYTIKPTWCGGRAACPGHRASCTAPLPCQACSTSWKYSRKNRTLLSRSLSIIGMNSGGTTWSPPIAS